MKGLRLLADRAMRNLAHSGVGRNPGAVRLADAMALPSLYAVLLAESSKKANQRHRDNREAPHLDSGLRRNGGQRKGRHKAGLWNEAMC